MLSLILLNSCKSFMEERPQESATSLISGFITEFQDAIDDRTGMNVLSEIHLKICYLSDLLNNIDDLDLDKITKEIEILNILFSSFEYYGNGKNGVADVRNLVFNGKNLPSRLKYIISVLKLDYKWKEHIPKKEVDIAIEYIIDLEELREVKKKVIDKSVLNLYGKIWNLSLVFSKEAIKCLIEKFLSSSYETFDKDKIVYLNSLLFYFEKESKVELYSKVFGVLKPILDSITDELNISDIEEEARKLQNEGRSTIISSLKYKIEKDTSDKRILELLAESEKHLNEKILSACHKSKLEKEKAIKEEQRARKEIAKKGEQIKLEREQRIEEEERKKGKYNLPLVATNRSHFIVGNNLDPSNQKITLNIEGVDLEATIHQNVDNKVRVILSGYIVEKKKRGRKQIKVVSSKDGHFSVPLQGNSVTLKVKDQNKLQKSVKFDFDQRSQELKTSFIGKDFTDIKYD